MKKLFLTLIAAISCLALNAETWTVGGVNYTVTRGTESYLGSSYHTLQQNITLNGSDGDQLKVFYSYTDLTNYDVAVEAVGAGSKLSNLNTVATMSGKTTSGTAVVGINADFFTSACPSGMFANEGTVHKAFTGDGFSAICIDPNKVPYIGKLTKHTCWLNNQTTSTEFGWSDNAAINTTSENATKCGVGEQIIFYTPQYGSASGNAEAGGYAVQLKPVNGAKLTPGKYLTYEVVSSPSSGSVTIPSDGIVLYGKGSSNGAGVKSLKVGDKITVYLRMQLTENDGTIVDVATSDNGATKYVHNALGGSQMILCNGNVITSYANNAGDPGYDAPRTAVGYNANKSRLYLCVVDGRNSGWTNGCTVKMMGDIMKNLGCSDALNFDGGGSSQFWTNTKGLINDANTNNLGNGIRAVKNSLFITNIPGATLSTSASSLSFATEDNATVAKSVTATVTNWRTNVSLSLSGANADQFSLSSSAITKSATGSGAVTVTYKPTTAGTHTATLTLTTNEYTNKTITKTITLTGTNTETVVTPPVEDNSVTVGSLTCNPGSITIEGVFGSSDVIYTDVKITNTDANRLLSCGSNTSAITVTTLEDWNETYGGTIRLTLNTNFILGVGTHNSFVAVECKHQTEEKYRIEIGTTVILTEDNTTAIEEVEVEVEVPVEYYNLQGVRVANPEKGLYIKRQGNNVTKVIL